MSVDVLVVNLTRFGDLLQSQALIDDLAKAGHSVGLVCLDNFAEAAGMLRNLSGIWPLPGGSLLLALDKGWTLSAGALLTWVEKVRNEAAPRHVFNLTPSLPARLLANLLTKNGANLQGFGIDSAGFGLNRGVWASFISVAAKNRGNSPFNLSDMLRRLGLPLSGSLSGSMLLKKPGEAALAKSVALLARDWPEDKKPVGFVGFQLGASEARRRWPVENFRVLGRKLWEEEGLCPVLLGSPSEKELGEVWQQGVNHPFINAIGATSLEELAALLSQCRLLVTNDTGTMHLAAGLGIPSLSFFLATAQPWDTGPLLPGCCCLEPRLNCHPCAFGKTCPNNEKCRQTITPGMAASLISGWLASGDWRQGITSEVGSSCRLWLTSGKEMCQLESLSGQEWEDRSLWLGARRAFWGKLLNEMDGLDPENISYPANFKLSAKTGQCLERAADLMASTVQCGMLAKKSAKGGELLLRNCERAQDVLNGCEQLGGLAAFWREFCQNQGENFDAFLSGAAILARNCRQLAQTGK